MDDIFFLLLLASMGGLVVGLVKPRLVRMASRGRAVLVFGAAIIFCFIGFGVTTETSPERAQPGLNATSETTPAPPKTDTSVLSIPMQPTTTPRDGLHSVITVVDGDTLAVQIDGESETVRLIGINTPETVDPRKPVECFGKEASAHARSLLSGKRVRLEADATQGNRDKYNRLLRYVFLEDGTFFNKVMISDGFAYEYTYDIPYAYQNEFNDAEYAARNAKRGLWADGACASPTATSMPAATPAQTPTSTPSGGSGYSVPACASSDCNCSDFSTHAYAQWFYDNHDPDNSHGLDGNSDGEACESLP